MIVIRAWNKTFIAFIFLVLFMGNMSTDVSADEITNDDVRHYVKTTHGLLDISDMVINEALGYAPWSHISTPFLDIFISRKKGSGLTNTLY